jgi:hypothetical protein
MEKKLEKFFIGSHIFLVALGTGLAVYGFVKTDLIATLTAMWIMLASIRAKMEDENSPNGSSAGAERYDAIMGLGYQDGLRASRTKTD